MIQYYLSGIFTTPPPLPPDHSAKTQPAAAAGLSVRQAVDRPGDGGRSAVDVLRQVGRLGIASFLSLPVVAFIRIMAAFAMVLFFIVHVYIITTGARRFRI